MWIQRHRTVIAIWIMMIVTTVLSMPMEGAHDAERASSIVKITAKNPDGQVSYATGFVWQQSTYVVTALHAVAGSTKITVYSEAQKTISPATIIRVHKTSDLALLEMEKDLGLPPLQTEAVDPNSTKEFCVWGYPHNVNTMQGDFIRFSQSLNQQHPTLENILKVSDALRKQLEKQGFPSINVEILRISSTIQPGHSGAPILTPEGAVIGIADGGLRGGVARINWAIPAEQYLPQLVNSADDVPTQTSLQTNLYRSTDQDSTKTDEMITTNAGQSLYKVSTMTIVDILKTLPQGSERLAELIDEIEDFADDIGMNTDLEQMLLDLYDNPEVGISLAIPSGMSVEAQQESFLISEKMIPIRMIVKTSHAENVKDALSDAQAFSKSIRQSDDWEKIPKEPDMKECEPDDQEQCVYTFVRESYNADDELDKELNESWEIDHGNFLGVAIIRDDPKVSEEEELFYELLLFCLDNFVKFPVL